MHGIAQNTTRLIRKKCFNQAAVAEKAGYNYKTFNNMLNGRKVITDRDVARIANALEVEPNELYGIKSQ